MWKKKKVKALVAQSCLILCDPMDCSPPGFSVHGILRARILEWVAIYFLRESSWSRDQTQVSCVVGRFFTIWATREAGLWKFSWIINILNITVVSITFVVRKTHGGGVLPFAGTSESLGSLDKIFDQAQCTPMITVCLWWFCMQTTLISLWWCLVFFPTGPSKV